jgi:hypothetical protein
VLQTIAALVLGRPLHVQRLAVFIEQLARERTSYSLLARAA